MPGVCLAWLGALLETCCHASAAMPLLIVLGLVAGRRGNAALCLLGNRVFALLGCIMACLGLIFFPYAYWLQLRSFNVSPADTWAPFLALPGLPWSTSMLAQLAGTLLLFRAMRLLARVECSGPRYDFSLVKRPALFFLWAAVCFFAAFFLINWPFAGLPQGLPMDRAVFAILRNAVRHYFMAFTPAGAIALAAFYKTWLPKRFPPAANGLACRWLAFWACVGLIPQTAQDWAIFIGLGLRGNAASYFPGGMAPHLLGLCLLTLAIFLWFWQALSKKAIKKAAMLALAFYLAQISLPYAWKIGQTLPMFAQTAIMEGKSIGEFAAQGDKLRYEKIILPI